MHPNERPSLSRHDRPPPETNIRFTIERTGVIVRRELWIMQETFEEKHYLLGSWKRCDGRHKLSWETEWFRVIQNESACRRIMIGIRMSAS